MAEVPARLANALRDRYTFERELGRGGMATVYLARDLKHDRRVAVKVLDPGLAGTLGPERFQREIRFAARLQHPHILTVFDSGEAAGQLWFTMPVVEGGSLGDRLEREGRLAVDEALRIARQAAQALQYAHEHGVVHRDIKPENLLLTTDGNTLVADFGIARPVAPDAHLTQTGVSVGTPAYMSPEQASGDMVIDARTDIYSLGVVLYEMLAGEAPFAGATTHAIIVKRLTEPAPSVRHVRASVPEAVDRAIQRALALSAAERFTTAGEFARALQTSPGAPRPATLRSALRRWSVPVATITMGLGALTGLGGLVSRWSRPYPAETAAPLRLAVLPFENLGDSADAYFTQGITNEVRGKLSQLAGLDVIARASSEEYRRTTKTPEQIARELGADYLLTATVQWEKVRGNPPRVRVSPELVRVESGVPPTTRWQQPFDAQLTGVFQVQADIASRVAAALDVALGDSVRRELSARPTADLAAYDAFLKGEAASQNMAAMDPPSLRRAVALYREAVAIDSTFVPAWAQLARAHVRLYANSIPTRIEAEAARHAAERAAALGPGRPEGPLAWGAYYAVVTLDYQRALAAFEAGLKLAPANIDLLRNAALAEQSLGRWEAALRHLTKAGALDPRSVNTATNTALTLLWLRRYPEAQATADRALVLAPGNPYTIQARAMVSLAQGDLAGARAVIRAALSTVEPAALLAYFANYNDLYWALDDEQQRQVLGLSPGAFDDDRGVWSLVRAETYYLHGNLARGRIYADSARLAFEEQLRVAPGDGQRHVFRGLALAYLGRKSEAIREGERAVALAPVARDANNAYNVHQLARIYVLLDEPERALDLLNTLLEMPYYLSPGWLRIDPTFARLEGHPRFKRLVAGM